MKKCLAAISISLVKLKPQVSPIDRTITILVYILFSLYALICVYPFYSIIINTISANDISAKGDVIFFPKHIQFHNYMDVFKIPGLWDAALVSVGRTVIGTILTVGASAFLGFMFTQGDMWGRKFWYRFTVITMFFNAGVIPWYLTMRSLHLTNNFLAYILPTIVAPFFIILVKTFVESTPKELQQAASIDGAGTMTLFFKIMLPICKPILATVAIFAAVDQWNSFQDTLLLVTDSKLYSLQFILYNYINQASSISSHGKSAKCRFDSHNKPGNQANYDFHSYDGNHYRCSANFVGLSDFPKVFCKGDYDRCSERIT